MPKNLLKRFLFAPIVASFIVSCVPYKSDYFTSVTSPALEPDHRLYKNVQLTSFRGIEEKAQEALRFYGNMDIHTLPLAANNGLRDSLDIAGMLAKDGDGEVVVTGRVQKIVKHKSWSTAKISVTSVFSIDYFGDLHSFKAVELAEVPNPASTGDLNPVLGGAVSLGFESLIIFLKNLSSQ